MTYLRILGHLVFAVITVLFLDSRVGIGGGGGMTPGSDNSSAITPPCSPPCDVMDTTETEEGELVTEVTDNKNGEMSEIR